MRHYRASMVLVAGLFAALSLAACSLNPKEDPTRYYVLALIGEDPGLYEAAGLTGETAEQASLSSGPHLDISVGVGPITLPGYLKRTRMATRQSDSELKYLETARWAQPLEESLKYAMVGNLSTLLWSDEVVFHPWYTTLRPDYSVEVDIARFERQSDGAATLAARQARTAMSIWSVSLPMMIASTLPRIRCAYALDCSQLIHLESCL